MGFKVVLLVNWKTGAVNLIYSCSYLCNLSVFMSVNKVIVYFEKNFARN